jgi:hypothetical protein
MAKNWILGKVYHSCDLCYDVPCRIADNRLNVKFRVGPNSKTKTNIAHILLES